MVFQQTDSQHAVQVFQRVCLQANAIRVVARNAVLHLSHFLVYLYNQRLYHVKFEGFVAAGDGFQIGEVNVSCHG